MKNHFDSLQILEKNYHFRVHKDLEVFPDWKEAVIYSNHRLIVIPAKRKASATYGHGYLRRFVFELDEVGKVMKGGILELSGLDTRILIENEKDLIAGYLHGKKISVVTYLWSDLRFRLLDGIQKDGTIVERSIDKILASNSDLRNFSFENCIDWYWVYSIGGEVIYEEYSHTTCAESCDGNTDLACLDDGTGSGGGSLVEDGIDCASFIFSNVTSAWRETGVSGVRFSIVYIDGSMRTTKTMEIPRVIYFGLPTAIHRTPYEAAEFTAGAVQRASDITQALVNQNPNMLDITIQNEFMKHLKSQMSTYGGNAGFYPSNGYNGSVFPAKYSILGNGDCD